MAARLRVPNAQPTPRGWTDRVGARVRVAAQLGLAVGIAVVAIQRLGAPAPPLEVLAEPAPSAGPRASEPIVVAIDDRAAVEARLGGPARGALAGGVASAPAPPEPRDAAWAVPADAIDPAHAVIVGDRMAQHLPDGTDVVLTLDPALQREAKRSLERYRVGYGAVVALDPRTGDVLALAEHAEGRPELRHMALQAEGPAASIFKIVSTAALVELAGFDRTTEICTHGGRRKLSLAHLSDDAKRDTRCETLAQALGASSNVAFARWADRNLQPADLERVADRFLFNKRLPFLWGVGRSRAQIPRASRLGFARAAAGFEGTTLSPLHAALIAATVANDGVMMAPRLVAYAERDGERLYEAERAELARPISLDTAREVTAAMVNTVTGGSAAKFFRKKRKPRFPGIAIAGKTGHLTSRGAGFASHYSWFVAFAPAESPEIAVAGLVVNGEEWTTKGVIPVRAVLEAWAERRADTPPER